MKLSPAKQAKWGNCRVQAGLAVTVVALEAGTMTKQTNNKA
jgi:hypothetical protein